MDLRIIVEVCNEKHDFEISKEARNRVSKHGLRLMKSLARTARKRDRWKG